MRADLPVGTVTFLFSDIESSTRLLERLGTEPYAQVLNLSPLVAQLLPPVDVDARLDLLVDLGEPLPVGGEPLGNRGRVSVERLRCLDRLLNLPAAEH